MQDRSVQLITPTNREPVKRTALRIGLSVKQTIRHCKAGRLACVQDAAGRYYSSAEAALAFMGFDDLYEESAAEVMRMAVGGGNYRSIGPATGTAIQKRGQKHQLCYPTELPEHAKNRISVGVNAGVYHPLPDIEGHLRRSSDVYRADTGTFSGDVQARADEIPQALRAVSRAHWRRLYLLRQRLRAGARKVSQSAASQRGEFSWHDRGALQARNAVGGDGVQALWPVARRSPSHQVRAALPRYHRRNTDGQAVRSRDVAGRIYGGTPRGDSKTDDRSEKVAHLHQRTNPAHPQGVRERAAQWLGICEYGCGPVAVAASARRSSNRSRNRAGAFSGRCDDQLDAHSPLAADGRHGSHIASEWDASRRTVPDAIGSDQRFGLVSDPVRPWYRTQDQQASLPQSDRVRRGCIGDPATVHRGGAGNDEHTSVHLAERAEPLRVCAGGFGSQRDQRSVYGAWHQAGLDDASASAREGNGRSGDRSAGDSRGAEQTGTQERIGGTGVYRSGGDVGLTQTIASVRVCDYCRAACIPSGRFCSGYCARSENEGGAA